MLNKMSGAFVFRFMQSIVDGVSAPTVSDSESTPIVIGTSFRNSPISYRERLVRALGERDWLSASGAAEWVVVQTCSRIEFVASSEEPLSVARSIAEKAEEELGESRFYVRMGRDAIVHLFRVAAGLDSIVLNEDQVLGQLRRAGRSARVAGTSKGVLAPLFDAAVSVGKRVRVATSDSGGSLAAFGLDVAIKRLGRRPSSVLLIGTGDVAKTIARMLPVEGLVIATRREGPVGSFPGARFIPWRELGSAASKSDLIVSASRHTGYTLGRTDIPDDRRRVILDLSFPRNIDPAFKDCKRIRHVDLDDLAYAASAPPPEAASRAATMVEQEAERFERWLTASRLSPTIAEIFRWADGVREGETEAALRRLGDLSPRERRVVEAMGRRIANKILARAALYAKSPTGDQQERLRVLKAIFAEGRE